MAQKLTRREIVQKDPISRVLSQASSWIVGNRKVLVSAIAAVVLVLIAGVLFQSYRQSRDQELHAVLADALAVYHAPVNEDSAAQPESEDPSDRQREKYRFETRQERSEKSLEKFRAVADKYEGTRGGDLALYYAGLTLLDMGQDRAEEAQKQLTSVVQESSYSDVKNLARNSLAQIAIENQDHAKAIELFTEILEEPAPSFPEQMILFRLAQCFETTGDKTSALERYRQLASDFAESPFAQQAQARISVLGGAEEAPAPAGDSASDSSAEEAETN